MGTTPSQSVPIDAAPGHPLVFAPLDPSLTEQLWMDSEAAACGLTQSEFDQILSGIGVAQNFGQPQDSVPLPAQQAEFFRAVKLPDLVLARACAAGKESAWERFLMLYQQPLIRAAIAITGNDTQGRDLADSLYAELYGLTMREGQRRCPLESYQGRGSLLGWLRTTLAQRHVDHYRRSHREEPLEESLHGNDPAAPQPEPVTRPRELSVLGNAVSSAIAARDAEDRFLLAAYYLDGRKLHQIAQVLHVHEATVSRKLRRLTDALRKAVLRNLQQAGWSKRAAQEALGTDPRDLDLNLKKFLQTKPSESFPDKTAS